ncbi:MAG: bifunctional adenosylcobinamide kinase/adenosylcobinamide-phosphate guanylyltransferase [Christensenellales bacterium]|jgi:adenosylcobinamide kinase/adenosylcobinamide-phosphate guanylyltransferase
MAIYISGGCKNGKSYHAQRIARDLGTPHYYVATMIPADEEDVARIRRHVDERAGWGFETIECPSGILSALDGANPDGAFLIDSTTALLSNEMFKRDGSVDEDAHIPLAREMIAFIERAPRTVIVSDYIFSDATMYPPLVERYRYALAAIDRQVAAHCDAVIEVVNSVMIFHKGDAACLRG